MGSEGLVVAAADLIYRSRTSDALYHVRVRPGVPITCTCKAYAGGRACWHAEDAARRLTAAALWPTPTPGSASGPSPEAAKREPAADPFARYDADRLMREGEPV